MHETTTPVSYFFLFRPHNGKASGLLLSRSSCSLSWSSISHSPPQAYPSKVVSVTYSLTLFSNMSEIMNEQYLRIRNVCRQMFIQRANRMETGECHEGCRTLDKPNVEENVSFCDWFKSQDFLKPLK